MTLDSSFEVQTYHKVDLRLIPFLFLCYILAYLDRVNVGFAKLQMLKDLSLSDAAFATGAGIFFIGYFFFEVPSNVLLKKYGARMWIARIMISWGVISACMIFVKSAWSFYAVRFLLGLAEAGFFPGIIFYLESSIEEAKWLTAEEKALLANNLEAEDKHKTEHKLSDAFASGKVWVLCVIYFTLMIGLYGIGFWLPTIVKAFGVKG